jgi:hypothetical protein
MTTPTMRPARDLLVLSSPPPKAASRRSGYGEGFCHTCGWPESEPPAACSNPDCELQHEIEEHRQQTRERLAREANS